MCCELDQYPCLPGEYMSFPFLLLAFICHLTFACLLPHQFPLSFICHLTFTCLLLFHSPFPFPVPQNVPPDAHARVQRRPPLQPSPHTASSANPQGNVLLHPPRAAGESSPAGAGGRGSRGRAPRARFLQARGADERRGF